MRRFLDRLYLACGVLAAVFMIAIAVLIFLSVFTRLTGTYVPGLTDYAGYVMAASSFLALAYTFGHGGHIRVNLVLSKLRGRARRALELWCHGVGGALAAYLAYYCVKMASVSYEIGELSEGPDATPLWIPQTALAVGSTVFAISVIDRFVVIALGGPVEIERDQSLGPIVD